jgi:DNA-binding LytR/AlgR family response regulator
VDDEPLAQELIERFVGRLPYLTLAGKFDNAIQAMEGIERIKPDLVFLDINMPEMTGIEFLSVLSAGRPGIIITTAYPQYALEGFEYDVADYLIKPIAFDRFVKAVNKVRDKLLPRPDQADLKPAPKEGGAGDKPAAPAERELTNPEKFFMVKEDKKLVKVNLSEIVFVEGMKDYVKIHLSDHFLVTHITMTKIAELLPPPWFIRINRSYIVQLAFIKLIEGNMIETSNGKKLPIGINYRDAVKEALQGWTI